MNSDRNRLRIIVALLAFLFVTLVLYESDLLSTVKAKLIYKMCIRDRGPLCISEKRWSLCGSYNLFETIDGN